MVTRLRVPLHDQGPALWPEYISKGELDAAHRAMGTPIFNASYQLEPGGLTGTIINPEWFRYGYVPESEDLLESQLLTECYMTVDPAISKSSAADYTAVAVGNVSPAGTTWVRWVWRGHVSSKESVQVIHQAWEYYKPVAIGVESVAYQSSLIEDLEARFPYLPLEPIMPDKDKLSRFFALGALYEFGQIIHHPTLKGTALEWELTRLPTGKHDDQADAVSMLTLMGGIRGVTVTNSRPAAWDARR